MGPPRRALNAAAAGAVYLAHNAFTHQLGGFRFRYYSYELVAQDPLEMHVSLDDLDIGVADAGRGDLDQRLPGPACGIGRSSRMRSFPS